VSVESPEERPTGAPADPSWWRSAVIYQVYIRSFADGDGDGMGDIAGLRARLPYLVELGIDALWINPWYPSPMADAGYDVADYRDVEPRFGTLADAEALLREAHEAGLRVLLDIVPNHSSDQHPWFQEALAAGPGSAARERYIFRPGRGPGGDQPPNDWASVFGGRAWTRITEPDGSPGEWYLHLFAPEQPDVNWTNPDVEADFEQTLRFWFDRGVDGFRIDVAHSLVKEEGLPDLEGRTYPASAGQPTAAQQPHPHWDRDEVHEIYRKWRAVADSYADPRVFVAEAWVELPERLARYVRPGELHTAFNFDFVRAPWNAAALRETIDSTMAEHEAVGAPPTWVLSNHDVTRHVSRLGRAQGDEPAFNLDDLIDRPLDLELGLRRARAAALLMFALPGGAYVYQGEELGLPEVEDLPEDALQDPTWVRSGHTQRGRDGCRVPLPWAGAEPPFGFSPDGASAPPWLPQPATWAEHTAERLSAEPDSILALYREALRLRRAHPALGDGGLRWLPSPDGALAFARDPGFGCVVNLAADPVPLPAGAQLLLSSRPLTAEGAVGPDTAAWFATAD
jgi:alpha-glucosidase